MQEGLIVEPGLQSPPQDAVESLTQPITQSAMRLFLAVRYRRNLVLAIMVAASALGGLYYATAERKYSAKASLLVSQVGQDRLNTSFTGEDSIRRNTMPTFENMIRSAKVLEGALKKLAPADRIDFGNGSKEACVGILQANLTAKTIRSTSILELTYCSKKPEVAVNVVRAVVQSYLDFMDEMHKGTAGDISRNLTKERDEVAEKLAKKQEELLEARRHFADMGFRSDGKTLHPTVQRAVFFNDALIAAQKRRVELEALSASIQNAIKKGEDLGQYLISAGDSVGREMLMNSLGLTNRDAAAHSSLEQDYLASQAQLRSLQQHLGPNHPEVVALTEKLRLTEEFFASTQTRISQRVAELRKSQLGPWLLQMMQQKLEETRKQEEILAARFEESRSEAINLSGQLAKIEILERDVKRLGDMNDVLLNQIASLDLRQNGTDVRVAVMEEPVIRKSPISPRLSVAMMLSVICGLSLSCGLVIMLDAFDDRFRSYEEMQSRLGIPLLTVVQRLEPTGSSGLPALVTHALPTSVASESFRTLRTALTLTHPDARQIVATSAEPGDGKTTMLANLAVCYAQAGKRTLLIDADLRRPGLTNLMNMRGPHGLSEILRSSGELADIVPRHLRLSGLEGLDIIPSGPRPSDPAELLGSPRLSQLLAWAETSYEMILIDSPPTLATTDSAIIGRLVDGVLLIVQPSKNRRRLVTRVVERLNLMKMPVLGFIANRNSLEKEHDYYGYQSYGYTPYGGEEDDPQGDAHSEADSRRPSEGSVPFPSHIRYDDEEDEDAPGLVVPRRVA